MFEVTDEMLAAGAAAISELNGGRKREYRRWDGLDEGNLTDDQREHLRAEEDRERKDDEERQATYLRATFCAMDAVRISKPLRYSVAEIDALRLACREKYIGDDAAIEMYLRTHMLAGHSAQDLAEPESVT